MIGLCRGKRKKAESTTRISIKTVQQSFAIT